eukprot:Rmarinus@m.1884
MTPWERHLQRLHSPHQAPRQRRRPVVSVRGTSSQRPLKTAQVWTRHETLLHPKMWGAGARERRQLLSCPSSPIVCCHCSPPNGCLSCLPVLRLPQLLLMLGVRWALVRMGCPTGRPGSSRAWRRGSGGLSSWDQHQVFVHQASLSYVVAQSLYAVTDS